MCCLASIGYFILGLRALYVVGVYVIYRKHMHHSFLKSVLSFIVLIFALGISITLTILLMMNDDDIIFMINISFFMINIFSSRNLFYPSSYGSI
jgi:hypothetical protein